MKSQQPQKACIDLTTVTEGGLLQYALALYRCGHNNEKEKSVFAKEIGRTEAHLEQCIADNAHIGVSSWLKIQKLLPTNLFDQWLAAQQTQLTENEK